MENQGIELLRILDLVTMDQFQGGQNRFIIMLTEFQDYWLIKVDACTVRRCSIDYTFTLELQDTTTELLLQVAGRFVVKHQAQEFHMIPTSPPQLGPALNLLGKQVNFLKLYKCGDLEAEFEQEWSLSVPADEQYEAWELVENDGIRVVSMPGGDLAIWQASKS